MDIGYQDATVGDNMLHANRATLWRTNCQLRPIRRPGKPGRRGLRRQWISPPLRRPLIVCVKHIVSHGGCFSKAIPSVPVRFVFTNQLSYAKDTFSR